MAAAEVHAVKEQRWCEMLNGGNAKGLADLYTNDCKVLAPGVPVLIGKDAFEKFAELLIASGMKANVSSHEIQPGADDTIDGDTFWENGKYELFKEDKSFTEVGKYMVIWKRVNGTIKLHREMWNSDQ